MVLDEPVMELDIVVAADQIFKALTAMVTWLAVIEACSRQARLTFEVKHGSGLPRVIRRRLIVSLYLVIAGSPARLIVSPTLQGRGFLLFGIQQVISEFNSFNNIVVD